MRSQTPHEKLILEYSEIPGLFSREALSVHFKLYEGYVDTLARVDESLLACPRPEKALPDHPFRALKEAESFASGGILLHEMYFGGLTPNPEILLFPIVNAISKKWGNISNWWQDMRATALVARGWSALGMCEVNPDDLRIFMIDSHNIGTMMGFSPLMCIDVFEHATVDFNFDKVSYLNAFPKFIKWSEINKRYLESRIAIEARISCG